MNDLENKTESAVEVVASAPDVTEIYGSFFLNSTEMAVHVDSIQEVVNCPEQFNVMPLAPDYVLGVFNLRGTIIPVISLKHLLKYESTENSHNQKIAIIESRGVKVGLLFDSTGEILRIRRSERSEFKYAENSAYKVIQGVIKLDDGARILQIIDPIALYNIENLPHIIELNISNGGHERKTSHQHHKKRKCISFNVRGLKLAIDINGIHEIVMFSNIQKSALESDICMGMLSLRGTVSPVVDFSKLLKLNGASQGSDSDRRIIILKLEHELVGLLVDSVESINYYFTDEIVPIPVLSKDRVSMFSGCITIEGMGDLMLLNHTEIPSNQEVLDITHGHSKVYSTKAQDASSKSKRSSVTRQSLISFKLGQLFGVSMKEVAEVINYSSEIMLAPGMPDFVKGLLNLRGQLITIIDTRSFYKMGVSGIDDSQTKILIFQNSTDRYGLVVDSIESIITINEACKIKLPSIFGQEAEKFFRQEIKEIIEVPGQGNKTSSLIVLDLPMLVDRIRAGAA